MFFKRRRKRPNINPNASLVNWIIIGVVAVAVIRNMGSPTPNVPLGGFKESVINAAPKAPIDFSNYKNIMSGDTAVMRMQDIEPGEGTPAVCGQKVTIAYDTFAADDTPLKDGASKESPLTFRIGANTVMPALEQGVVGISKGGVRNLFAPPHLAYGLKEYARDDVPGDSTIRFKVEMLDLSPQLPDMEASLFRIINVQRGTGKPLLCGEPVKAHITVWGVDGKKLYSTRDEGKEPLVFTPGKSQVMLGIEQGVIGMGSKGARTLIIPPAFQNNMDGSKPEMEIPLPENQTVLVDIESVS